MIGKHINTRNVRYQGQRHFGDVLQSNIISDVIRFRVQIHEFFEEFFNIALERTFFHSLAHISCKKLIGPWWKFYPRCICVQARILKVIRMRRLNLDQTLPGGGMNSPTARCFEFIRLLCIDYLVHRRSQDFLWGCTFFVNKLMTFLVVVLDTQAKTANLTTPALKSSPAQQKFLQTFDLLLCLGGCTHNFSL